MTLETEFAAVAPPPETAQLEGLSPLMRPNQVEEALEERKRLQSQIDITGKPAWEQASVEARRDAARLLGRIDKQLGSQVPTAYDREELDTAVAREAHLREQFTTGMPTQEEMRRNPAGAVDKHRSWEARNKAAILEWKNVRLRLHAGGDIKDVPRDANDIANMEMYRPSGGVGQMNLDNAQINPPTFFLPPVGVEPSTVFSDDDMDLLAELSPDTRNAIIVMTNEARAATMDILRLFRERTATNDGGSSIIEPEVEAKAKPKAPKK